MNSPNYDSNVRYN